MKNSKIEWTTHTFNPWRSCAHKKLADGTTHPACEHCYAEAMAKRFPDKLGQWGEEGTRIMAPEKLWRQPLAWNKQAEATGERARVFCASIADVFEDWQGPIWNAAGETQYVFGGDDDGREMRMDDLRARLFALIDATPNLDWLLLTKRPENILEMWPLEECEHCLGDHDGCEVCYGQVLQYERKNVWLGTSISNQQSADELIPRLLACRDLSPVLFLSAEPLLGPVDLFGERVFCRHHERFEQVGWSLNEKSPCFRGQAYVRDMIDWVICGGESGPQARPMHPDWARSLRDQCQAASVPFFFKQWGEWQNGSHINGRQACVLNDGRFAYPDTKQSREQLDRESAYSWHRFAATSMAKVGKHESGRLLDGHEWSEFPAVVHTEAPRHRGETV